MARRDARRRIKKGLSRLPAGDRPARGLTTLIYHRVGGGSPDERDCDVADFWVQADVLARYRVVALDTALDELERHDERPKVVLTFDDGFQDVYENALPRLVEHRLPFTVYLATQYIGGSMHWDGSTAKAAGPALTWSQLAEMQATGLMTIGNHTHSHCRPELLDRDEFERCSDEIASHLGVAPRHFAYTWGVPVPRMEQEVRARFRSAVTGIRGRNGAGSDLHRLRRIPVRGSDPLAFFECKLKGSLVPEHTYEGIVRSAKALGLRS